MLDDGALLFTYTTHDIDGNVGSAATLHQA